LPIWKTDLEGATPVQMTPEGHFKTPGWHPDGKSIAFLKQEARDPEDPAAGYDYTLAFIEADEPGRITREVKVKTGLAVPPQVSWLRYSPDGQWLSCKVIGWGRLGAIDPQTGQFYPLFDGGFARLSFSRRARATGGSLRVWLPDSQRFLVTVGGGDEVIGFWSRIWLVNLAGEARQLGEGRILGGPDHGRIVFIEKAGQIYRVDFE